MKNKMQRTFLFLLTAITILFSACSTDLDINAPYKRTTIVYGLLNQNDSVQTVRIQHSFLGKASAYDMAKEKDSLFYKPNEISVQIKKMLNNQEVGAVTLYEVRRNTDAGIFASDSIPMYQTLAKDSDFFDSKAPDQANPTTFYQYNLVVSEAATGKVISAKTNLIPDFSVTWLATSVAFRGQGKYINPVVSWSAPYFGRVYNMSMRFYYTEFDPTTGERKDTSYIEFPFGSQTSSSLNGTQELTQKIDGETFYRVLKDSLDARDRRNGFRYVRYINYFPSNIQATPNENVWFTFTFNVGNDDLNTYINLNAPSTGLVQEKPLFTNVNNGIGLFASRTSKTIRKKIEKETNEELFSGAVTNGLFRKCDAGTSFMFCQ